jgi:hypothetical protein
MNLANLRILREHPSRGPGGMGKVTVPLMCH